jgi:uncharacterized protein (DUF983 family)
MSNRRGDEKLTGAAQEIWRPLERVAETRGDRQGRLFEDWLGLMLAAVCALGDNFQRGNIRPAEFDGPHEEAYKAIAARYVFPVGKQRGIDLLAEAYGRLAQTLEQDPWQDPLGEIFEARVSYGEHGQFFTPWSLCQMMAQLQGEHVPQGARVGDPACGSGRMLLAMAEREPSCELHGQDTDGRCCAMSVLNFSLRGLSGVVVEGNSLTLETRRRWRIWRGLVRELPKDAPEEAIAAVAALVAAEDLGIAPEALAAGRLF